MFTGLSLRQCLVSLALFSALILFGMIWLAQVQLNALGKDLDRIANRNIPLMELVTKLTVSQFGEAVSVERAMRFGTKMRTDAAMVTSFDAAASEFEIHRGNFIASLDQLRDHIGKGSAEQQGGVLSIDFTFLNETVDRIDDAHETLAAKAAGAFEALRRGDVDQAASLAGDIQTTALILQIDNEGLMAEISRSMGDSVEASQASQASQAVSEKILWSGGAVALVLTLLVSLFFARVTVGPLMQIRSVMLALADGDFNCEIPFLKHRAEIGEMARAVNIFKQRSIEAERLREEREKEGEERQEEIRKKMLSLAGALEEALETSVQEIADRTDQMRNHAQRMGTTADDVSAQATTVASASEQASSNVATVAAAASELASIASEINSNVMQSAEVAKSAVEEARVTNASVKGLTEAAGRIGDVVSLISEIAEQTNLLALNATIEAARAGESGKGFAVVAHEVKNLATQTAQATNEIGEQVRSIRDATDGAVSAIDAIGRTVLELDERSRTVAAAVEKQESATREIAANAQQLSLGTQEVSSSISQVSAASGEASTLAQDVSTASDNISESMSDLQLNLRKVLRTSHAVDRRTAKRVSVDLEARYNSSGAWRPCTIQNISTGGAFLKGIESPFEGKTIHLRVPEIGDLKAQIIQVGSDECGVSFDLEGDEVEAALRARFGDAPILEEQAA